MFRFLDAPAISRGRGFPCCPRTATRAKATGRAGSALRLPLRRISPRSAPWWGAVFLSIVLFLFLSSPALAGLGYWSQSGPLETDVTALAIHPFNPDIVYVSGLPRGRIYRSVDGGASWSSFDRFSSTVEKLWIDPVQPRRIYASIGGTFFRSEDSAATWHGSQVGTRINDLVIDPRHPAVLYVAGRGYVNPQGTRYPTYVYKSLDHGESWSQVATETRGTTHLALALDPLDSSVVYVATNRGLWKSVDAGATWRAVTPPGSVGSEALDVTAAVAVDPGASGVVYYAAADGFFKSLNGGDSWFAGQGAPGTFHELVIDPQDTSRLYGATEDGLYRSLDAGATWQRIRRRAACTRVHTVALDPADPRKVWAGARGEGLVRSPDGGASWVVLRVAEDQRVEVLSLLALPGPPATLFAGSATSGVYRSTDGGRTWERRDQRLDRPRIQALLPPGGGSGLLAGTDRGLFRSADEGQRWQPWSAGELASSSVLSLARDPQSATGLYAGTRAGVFRSRDGGATWSRSPVPSAIDSAAVVDLAVNPTRSREVWAAAGDDGLFRSRDGGTTWTRLRSFGERTESVLVDPRITSTVYVGADNGLYRSLDSGGNWAHVTVGLCTTSCPAVHRLMSTHRSLIWACTEGGAYSSRDQGRRWQAFEGTSLGLTCRALAPHPWSPATLFVGNGSGVYDRQTIGCTGSDELCLGRGPDNLYRFRVELTWRDFEGHRDVAGLRPHVTQDSGVFWFFDRDSWELLAKVIDGTAYDGHHWVFAGATSNVELGLRVTDQFSGRARLYYNPLGQTPITLAEIGVFPNEPDPVSPGAVVEEVVTLPPSSPPQRSFGFDPTAVGELCVASATEHCFLGGRFRVGVTWRDFDGHQGVGRTEPYPSDDSGLVWFFDPQNHELLLKMVDGCGYNGRYWVFAAATTNVEYDLVVTDTTNGATVTYHNPLGQPAATVTDIEALTGCP